MFYNSAGNQNHKGDNMNRNKLLNQLRSLFFIIASIAVSLSAIIKAEEKSYNSFEVKISGKGEPVLFIHGYASSSDVWNETIEYLENDFECHQIQLPGFAGSKSINEDEYLSTLRDEIAGYIAKNKLGKVQLVGHSLGGFLSLWIASEYPEIIKKVVSVDGLPFLGTVINPGATSGSMIKTAKKQFNYENNFAPSGNRMSDEQLKMMFETMTIHKDKKDLLLSWTKKSDGRTLNQAMFELMITDIREDIKNIKSPVLCFGAWIAYKKWGATRKSTKNLYSSLYKNVDDFTIKLTDKGKHFIMWDDFEWYSKILKEFLVK